MNDVKTISYKEPTYALKLTSPAALPQNASTTPYSSLSRLVDEVARSRYPGQTLSSLKRRELASSLMNRPDQKSSLQILPSLAQEQGLFAAAAAQFQRIYRTCLGFVNFGGKILSSEGRMEPEAISSSACEGECGFQDLKDADKNSQNLSRYGIEEGVDFTLIAAWVFSSGSFMALNDQLRSLKLSPDLQKQLFEKACSLREELQTITSGTMHYIRPSQKTDGEAYIDHLGNTVTLSQTIPSSFDRDHPDVQNSRMNLNSQDHVIYSTGRIETERKANQVIDALIDQTLSSGQIEEHHLILQKDGTYLYPLAIENLINPSPAGAKERNYLLQQEKTLQKLNGEIRSATLKNGKKVTLVLKPMHFSTHSNYNLFLGQSNRWTSTGSDLAEEITDRGIKTLQEIYQLRKESLTPEDQQSIEQSLASLQEGPSAQDRYILRAFICEKLNIPYHIHCKSSKDRTAVLAALKKAIHQWLKLEEWQKKETSVLDPRELLKNPVFREYSEAAFFENLPMTDQGIGLSGQLDGKIYTPDRGYDYRFSLIANPIATLVLSDRYLQRPSLVERTLYTLSMTLVSLIAASVYITLLPLILPALYYKFKDQALSIANYIFLTLTIFPPLSASREKWLDRSSPILQERRFFRTKNPTQTAPELQTLFDTLNALSPSDYRNFLHFIKKGDDSSLTYAHLDLLQQIGSNWLTLQQQLKAKETMPFRIKEILNATPASPVLLFQYLAKFSQPLIWEELQKNRIAWPADNYDEAVVREALQFLDDYRRINIVVQGKRKRHDLPKEETENRLDRINAALQDLSVCQGLKKVPLPIQEALTQSTTISYVTSAIWQSFNTLTTPPPNQSNRTLILEEGSDSFFYLTIKETTKIVEELSFDYIYRFKISKVTSDEWTTELVSLSPLEPKVGKVKDLNFLLQTSEPIDTSTTLSKLLFSTLLDQIIHNLEAAALCQDEPARLNRINKQIEKQRNILSTQFDPKLFQLPEYADKLKHFTSLTSKTSAIKNAVTKI